MKKLLAISIGLICLLQTAIAQDIVTLYYNRNWEITREDSAVYKREARYDLNNFKLNGAFKDYYLNGLVLMEGSYLQGKRNGLFTNYYVNGNLKSRGEYSDNKRTGRWEYYYLDGSLKQIVDFFLVGNKLDFSVYEYYDAEGKQKISDGTGVWINDSIQTGMFDKASYKRLRGKFIEGKKTGGWSLLRLSDKKVMHIEYFRKGEFIDGRVYNVPMKYMGTVYSEILNKFPDDNSQIFKNTERFKLDSLFFPQSLIYSDVETIFTRLTGKKVKIMNRTAGYPLGDYSLMAFIQKNIKYPAQAAFDRLNGTVYLTVTVDSLGKTEDIKVLKGIREDVDSEAVRVVSLVESWLPALRNGKAVKSSFSIPVRFEVK